MGVDVEQAAWGRSAARVERVRAVHELDVRDALGRGLRDLRISVTDRCNFRCRYCMPKEVFGPDHAFLPRRDLLSFEEIERLVRAFAGLGVRKVRITGGEPLLRRHLERLIEKIACVEGIEDISLTTNGSVLTREKAQRLRDAGLRRINVSLDALDDPTFQAINDVRFPVARVLEAIDHAAAAGLSPVKINAVIKRGVNEHAILDLAEHFRGSPHVVRYIEFMDVGSSNGWRMDDVIPAREIIARIHAAHPLEPVHPAYHGEVAKRWRYVDGQGEIGVITSVTEAFCRSCCRARISAKGDLFTCLFAQDGHSLRELVRSGADTAALQQAIVQVWAGRRDRYSEIRTEATAARAKVEMSYIGG